MHVQLDPVFTGRNFRTGFLKLEQHSFEDGRIGVLDLDATAGNGSGHQVSAGLDTVRHDLVSGRAQTLDAIDGDGVGTCAVNLGTHCDQEVGQIDNLWLARGVLQHAATVGEAGSHHDVFSTGHAHGIEEEMRTTQAAFRCLGLDVATFDVDDRAHGFKATDVQVDRTRTDGTATWQSHFGLAEASDHRAQHQNRRTHGFHQLVRGDQGLDGARVDLDTELFVDHRLDAHATEQLDHGRDVVQVRQVLNGNGSVRQQGGGKDRQGRVLCPGNANFAIKTNAAGNNQFIH